MSFKRRLKNSHPAWKYFLSKIKTKHSGHSFPSLQLFGSQFTRSSYREDSRLHSKFRFGRDSTDGSSTLLWERSRKLFTDHFPFPPNLKYGGFPMSPSRALILDLMQLCVTKYGQLSWVLGNVCVSFLVAWVHTTNWPSYRKPASHCALLTEAH